MKQNRDILSEDEVFVGATYFVYHLKMFLESILWMQENYSGSKYQIKITNDKLYQEINIKYQVQPHGIFSIMQFSILT